MLRFDQLTTAVALASAVTITGCSDQGLSGTQSAELGVQSAATLVASSAPTLTDPATLANIRSAALAVASQAGVPKPATMQVVAAADHQAAETIVSGAIIDDDSPAYVVVMTGGTFSAPSTAPDGTVPQGTVLTVTLDAQDYGWTDLGVDDVAPDLTLISANVVNL